MADRVIMSLSVAIENGLLIEVEPRGRVGETVKRWWRRRYAVNESELVVSLGEITWRRVVTGVKADADGGLVLSWEWRTADGAAFPAFVWRNDDDV